MKKSVAVLSVLLMLFLCACNQGEKSNENDTSSTEAETEPLVVETVQSLEIEELDPAKVFIAYFSHNDPVKAVAEYVYEKNDGVLHRIETTIEYPDDEAELVKIAASEFRPELKNTPDDLFSYDIVFLCFPAWNNTMPKALFTFIEDYSMSGKAIIPVCYGTEQELQNAIRDIRILKPNLMIVDGYSFTADFTTVSKDFDEWMNLSLFG